MTTNEISFIETDEYEQWVKEGCNEISREEAIAYNSIDPCYFKKKEIYDEYNFYDIESCINYIIDNTQTYREIINKRYKTVKNDNSKPKKLVYILFLALTRIIKEIVKDSNNKKLTTNIFIKYLDNVYYNIYHIKTYYNNNNNSDVYKNNKYSCSYRNIYGVISRYIPKEQIKISFGIFDP